MPIDTTSPLSDFVPLAGPYNKQEFWMLGAAVAQLEPIRWTTTHEPAGAMLWRDAKGWLPVEEEEV